MPPFPLALVSAVVVAGVHAQHVHAQHIGIPNVPAVASGSTLAATSGVARSSPRIAFVPNLGQWSSPELFRAQTGGLDYYFERGGWSFWLREPPEATAGANLGRVRGFPRGDQRAVALRMRFAGHRDTVCVEPGAPLGGVLNFLVGDAARHRSGVTAHESLLYRGMYNGIDVRVRDGGQHLEYDLLLAPGADLGSVQVEVAGARLRLEATGVLALETELGRVEQQPPVAWMVAPDGAKRPVACELVLRDAKSFGFRVKDRDPALPLVVDPSLLYSTYWGGSGTEEPRSMRQDASGRVLLCGGTRSSSFPTTPGAFKTVKQGDWEGFITCLDPTQLVTNQRIFSTFIGGTADDSVSDVAVLPTGSIAFAGHTTSDGLAVGAAAQPTRGGASDAMFGVLKFDGSALLGLTYHGGSNDDWVMGLGVASNGNCVLTGETTSNDLPVTHGTLQGISDGFVTEMLSLGVARPYSTYVGGPGIDRVNFAYTHGAGMVLIGESSGGFPVTSGAYDTSFNGGATDVLLLRWDHWSHPAQPILYATYAGGGGDDYPVEAVLASNGQVVLTGTTASADFPVTLGTYQTIYGGGNASYAGDAFVMRLDPQGQGAKDLVFSTFLGGPSPEQGLGGCVDSNGEITIVGWAGTSNGWHFPRTPDGRRRTYVNNEGFLARLSADGRQLLYSTYIGGGGGDGAWFVTRYADGVVTVGGAVNSSDFETTINATQPQRPGAQDAFVQRWDMRWANTTRYGTPSPSGPRWPTIHAMGDAIPSNPGFGLACSRAPTSTPGVLLISAGSASLQVLGIRLLVDVSVSVMLPVAADASGEHVWSVRYPAAPITAYAQYLWFDSLAPWRLSASDALRF